MKSLGVVLAQKPLRLTGDLDEKCLAFGNNGAVIELGVRLDLEAPARLSDNPSAKGYPLSQAHRVPQANLETSGHGGHAAQPDGIDHTFVENRRQNAAVHDAGKALEAIGNEARGAHAAGSFRLEVEMETMRVMLAAHETALIVLKFHGMPSACVPFVSTLESMCYIHRSRADCQLNSVESVCRPDGISAREDGQGFGGDVGGIGLNCERS